MISLDFKRWKKKIWFKYFFNNIINLTENHSKVESDYKLGLDTNLVIYDTSIL